MLIHNFLLDDSNSCIEGGIQINNLQISLDYKLCIVNILEPS